MTKEELAKKLGEILGETKLSDAQIIDCYNRCSSCGRRAIPADDLDLVIESVSSAEEFIEKLGSLDSSLQKAAHKAGCHEANDA